MTARRKAAAAALALACAAFAGPAPAAEPGSALGGTELTVTAAGQRAEFRATLAANRDYAISAETFADAQGRVTVLAPGGRRVARCEGVIGSRSNGCEFRSAAAGSYRFVAEITSFGGEPGLVEIDAWNDCKGARDTLCSIRPGARQTGTSVWYQSTRNEDDDWRRVELAAGQKYQVVGSSGIDVPACEVRDPAGAVVATCDFRLGASLGCTTSEANCAVARFTARRSGVHHVVVSSGTGDPFQRYAVRLDRGWPAPRP